MRAAACDAPARAVRAPVMGLSSSSHGLIHQAVEMVHCKAPATAALEIMIMGGHVWRYLLFAHLEVRLEILLAVPSG